MPRPEDVHVQRLVLAGNNQCFHFATWLQTKKELQKCVQLSYISRATDVHDFHGIGRTSADPVSVAVRNVYADTTGNFTASWQHAVLVVRRTCPKAPSPNFLPSLKFWKNLGGSLALGQLNFTTFVWGTVLPSSAKAVDVAASEGVAGPQWEPKSPPYAEWRALPQFLQIKNWTLVFCN